MILATSWCREDADNDAAAQTPSRAASDHVDHVERDRQDHRREDDQREVI